MLTLLCTAPQSAISSPVEDPSSPSRSRAPPPNFSSTSAVCEGSCSSPTSSRKVSLPLRRPSIRKRIQSISRASGASIDKATATLTNAAGSSFSFLRHASSSGSGSPSPSRKSPSSHVRGASTSSFASGKSSSKNSNVSSSSSPNKSRLNVLDIGPPSAFKHEFHLGPNSRNDGTWDESRWRRVFGMPASENTPIIDVVSSANTEQPRTSTSSERHHQFLSRSHSQSHADRPNNAHASHSSPNLLSIACSPSSPSQASGSSDGQLPEDGTVVDKAKAAKAAKRASLVKRKPVPPLYPEDEVPVPATSPSTPAPMTFMLMPDVPPSQFPETAPAGKTTFSLEAAPEVPSARLSQEQSREKEDKPDTETPGPSNTMKEEKQAQTTTTATATCPAHICILHNAPAPTPPPRRHTLAYMQARALGRGLGDVPSRPAGTVVDSETKPKSRPRPVPIVAPSPGTVSEMSPGGPALPPGLSSPPTQTSEENTVKEEDQQIEEETKAVVENENENNEDVVGDSSPRPSFSSLVSGSGSHSSSSSSGSDSCEPRTPTDERRISAGSTASMGVKLAQVEEAELEVEGEEDVTVTIVTDGDVEEEGAVEQTPTKMRRVSKRPNPPARRVETTEDSIYVTADEADEA